jgi:CheY-like chemotaxis protein
MVPEWASGRPPDGRPFGYAVERALRRPAASGGYSISGATLVHMVGQPSDEAAMTRVLLGDFAAIYRLGLEDILDLTGVQLVSAAGSDVLEQLVSALPDVVVLDLDKSDTPMVIGVITADFPAVRIVACSSERPRMHVYPARHYGEYYTSAIEPDDLVAAVQS